MFLLTLILCVVAIILLFRLYVWLKVQSKFWTTIGKVPGPRGYPVIGNLFELATSPSELFKVDREYGLKYFPIYKVSAFHKVSVNLLNPEDIELVLTDTKHNTKSEVYDLLHGWLGTGLLTSWGNKWQKRRKILTPAFHFNILQEFIDIFNNETRNLVKSLEDQCHEPFIDVITPITQFTLASILETAMGIGFNDMSTENQVEYKNGIYRFGHLFINRVTRPWLFNQYIYEKTKLGKEEKRIVNFLHNISANVILERKKKFQSSTDKNLSYTDRKRLAMLDLLLSAQANGAEIDDEGIREEVDTFLFEGHDTTSMAICYILMLLANHKETQDEIVQEMHEVFGGDLNKIPNYNELQELKFMERCIKEALRLYPSVPLISRIAGEDIYTVSGYTIPKDSVVNIHIYDLHHNPNVFPDPEKFDPNRFLPENMQNRHSFSYVPFSAGPRNCIGQRFAVLELKAVLCGILAKFYLEPVDTPKSLVFVSDLVLRTNNGIKVKFVPK